MNERKKVSIGFCGSGNMGQCAHLKHYATLPDCQVTALAEPREKTAKAVAQRYNIPKVYRTHTEMLASEKLDGIVASQQFTRHGVLLPELVKAGKPIFIEKPLAGSVAVGEKILESLAGSEAFVMVGYHKRSDPAAAYAKAEIEKLKASGEIGKLKYVRICMPAGDWIAGGFSDLINIKEEIPAKLEWDPPAKDMPEAVYKEYVKFVNYYIHQVNLMRFLLGEPYRVTFADRAGLLLAGESQSGTTVTIEMSPYQTTRDWQESALVAFERGYVKLELPAPLATNRPGRVEILKDPGQAFVPTTTAPTLPWVSAMRQQAMNFVAAVRGERKPPCEAAEALEDLKVALEYVRLWKSNEADWL